VYYVPYEDVKERTNERTNECTHCEWNMYVCISLIAHAFGRSITHSYGSARERKVLACFVEKEKQNIIFLSPSSRWRVPDILTNVIQLQSVRPSIFFINIIIIRIKKLIKRIEIKSLKFNKLPWVEWIEKLSILLFRRCNKKYLEIQFHQLS